MTDSKKLDPFKPQQPAIPGIPAQAPKKETAPPPQTFESPSRAPKPPQNSYVWFAIAAGIAILGLRIAWWAHGSSAKSAPAPVTEVRVEPPPAPIKPVEKLPVGPGQIVRADELSKPWSSKKFLYRDPYSTEEIPAIVVRLPGGSFWAISLREPYGNCNLEYVTDLETIREKYHFNAEHPMVVDPCGRIVYELARYGNGPNGLVRGAVVKGTAVRPPIAIEVESSGNWIQAVRIENTR